MFSMRVNCGSPGCRVSAMPKLSDQQNAGHSSPWMEHINLSLELFALCGRPAALSCQLRRPVFKSYQCVTNQVMFGRTTMRAFFAIALGAFLLLVTFADEVFAQRRGGIGRGGVGRGFVGRGYVGRGYVGRGIGYRGTRLSRTCLSRCWIWLPAFGQKGRDRRRPCGRWPGIRILRRILWRV